MAGSGKFARDAFSFNPEKCRIDDDTKFLHLEDITSTPAGIMTYPEDDNESRYFPPEVLKRDMITMADVPVAIMMHPENHIIDQSNIDQYGKGHVKSDVSFKDNVIKPKAVIEKKDAIDKILRREIGETSAGYTYWDDGKPGVNEYGKFDTTITKIKFNHLLITDIGRAGQKSKVGLDTNKEVKPMSKERELSPVKVAGITLDKETITFDPEKSQSAIDSYSRRETTLIEGLKTLNDEKTALELTLKSTKETLETAKKAADGKIDRSDVHKLIRETVYVDKIIGKLGLDSGANPQVKEDDELITKKLAAIKKLTPKAYEDLETEKRLDNKVAVDSTFSGSVANLELNQEIQDIENLYRDGQRQSASDGMRLTPPGVGFDINKTPSFQQIVTQKRITR